jgi:type IV secretion system protein VirB4
MDDLLDQGPRNTLPVLLYLFHRIEQRLDGRPTLIVIEEAWRAPLNGTFAEKIGEWLKTLRKANAAVLFVTQEIGDLYQASNAESIFNACQTRIFLPNPNARHGDAQVLYRRLGLNRRQIDLISNATPKRDYYFASPQGRRMIDLNLGAVALSFVGVGGREDLAAVRDFVAKYGDDWPAEWLSSRGLADWASYWRSIAEGERE